MDKLVPILLLALGLGAAHLGIAGLLKLRPEQREFWVFGLGVRTRFGAVKVLIVALALIFLAYSFHKRGSLTQILAPDSAQLQEQYNSLAIQLREVEKSLTAYQSQIETLNREKEDCQNIVSRQGLGLANKNDTVGELHTSLTARQKELAELQGNFGQVKEQLGLLQREYDQTTEAYNQTKEKVQQLESQIDVLQNEKVSLKLKQDQLSSENEIELKRLREETTRLRSLYRDQEHRASLLRQGLVLREANDWALEQEIQRLANLISDQPDVSSPRQTDISRALHKISQTLREGTALTKQAKAADTKPSDVKSAPAKTSDAPATKNN
jgi:chromosome segregation ATPase